MNIPAWLPAAVGYILEGAALASIDRILPHLHIRFPMEEAEGIPTSWPRSTLQVLAITMHNIPEGLAVGVAFGALAAGYPIRGVGGGSNNRPACPMPLPLPAGAMIFVVVKEVIPESRHNGNADAATFGAMLGFVVMRILDVGLG